MHDLQCLEICASQYRQRNRVIFPLLLIGKRFLPRSGVYESNLAALDGLDISQGSSNFVLCHVYMFTLSADISSVYFH